MGKTVYISQSGSRWKTSWGKDSAGILYNSKTHALKEAMHMVGKLPEGKCIRIMLQEHGVFQPKWEYGKDPFPPKE